MSNHLKMLRHSSKSPDIKRAQWNTGRAAMFLRLTKQLAYADVCVVAELNWTFGMRSRYNLRMVSVGLFFCRETARHPSAIDTTSFRASHAENSSSSSEQPTTSHTKQSSIHISTLQLCIRVNININLLTTVKKAFHRQKIWIVFSVAVFVHTFCNHCKMLAQQQNLQHNQC